MTKNEVLERAEKALKDCDPLPFHAAGLVLEQAEEKDQAKKWYVQALKCYGYMPALEKLEKLFPHQQFEDIYNQNRNIELGDSAYPRIHITGQQRTRYIAWLSQSAAMGSAKSKREWDQCEDTLELDTKKIHDSYLLHRLEMLLAQEANPQEIADIYDALGQKETALAWYSKAACDGSRSALSKLEEAGALPASIDLEEVRANYEQYWDARVEEAVIKADPVNVNMLIDNLLSMNNFKYTQRLYALAKEQGWQSVEENFQNWGIVPQCHPTPH